MTTYHVTAWCALPHYTTFEVQADSIEDALAKAREQVVNEHPEPCNGGEYDWDEFHSDSEDDDAPDVYYLEPNARLNSAARELLELLKYAYGILGHIYDGEAVSTEEIGCALQPCADAIAKATQP